MLLQSLSLKNIRSYVDAKIEFPDKYLLLAGDIGSGKTTVLLAIEFALFGLLRTELPGNALLRNGRHVGEVELAFKLDDKEIIIKSWVVIPFQIVPTQGGFCIKRYPKPAAPATFRPRF
ncbi:MAG: AAA family ATPase, partial [Candidatus Woesearchaeota archaeon]|nr:AAA family ATPase [Candidatus Woesearchaeota archaeon]